MAYSEKQIADAVSTVHMNSKRQSRRNKVINYANADINFIGSKFFVYSGDIPASVSTSTPLDFTTGPSFLCGKVIWNGHVDNNNIGVGVIGTVEISLNDKVVATLVCDTGAEDQPTQCFLEMVIPPFTNIKMKCSSNNNDTNSMASIVFTGDVYSGAEVIQGAI